MNMFLRLSEETLIIFYIKQGLPFIIKGNNLFFSLGTYYILDVLWGQPIKLIQVASTSELRKNQRNDLLFFEIVPSHCFGASEVQT